MTTSTSGTSPPTSIRPSFLTTRRETTNGSTLLTHSPMIRSGLVVGGKSLRSGTPRIPHVKGTTSISRDRRSMSQSNRLKILWSRSAQSQMSKQVNDLRLILVRISCGDHLLITYLLERPHSVQFQVNTYTVLDFCQRMLK